MTDAIDSGSSAASTLGGGCGAAPRMSSAGHPASPGIIWPIGHAAWVFRGISQFEGRVAGFLAQGAARGECLMFVADDPGQARWPRRLVDSGALVIASTAEIYGAERVVKAHSQRETFAATLSQALGEGYTGIRVVADNTSLIVGQERLDAWLEWEAVAGEFMAENPVNGLCAFDELRADREVLDQLVGLHPATICAPPAG